MGHPKCTNSILISEDCEEENAGIKLYNLETNTFSQLIKYKVDDKESNIFIGTWNSLEEHGQFVDTINDEFLIFGGTFNAFLTFDLNQENLTVHFQDKMPNEFKEMSIRSRSVQVGNEVHILDEIGGHYKYDCITQQYVYISSKLTEIAEIKGSRYCGYRSDDGWVTYGPKLIYVRSKNQLMMTAFIYMIWIKLQLRNGHIMRICHVILKIA